MGIQVAGAVSPAANVFPNISGGAPTGANGVTFDRFDTAASTAAAALIASGTMSMTPIRLAAGSTITNISFRSGATAAISPTNWWLALYNTSLALLAQTADQLTGAIAANTVFTKALTTPYVVPTTGYYLIGLMVAAATVPTITSNTASLASLTALVPVYLGTSTAGLTTTPPDPAGAISNTAILPYMWTT